MFYVYFARSVKHDKIYVGSTSKHPDIRIKEHNQGSNAWSKNNGPFKLVYYENFICKEDAIAKEAFYKTGIGRKIKSAICNVMDD